MSWPALLAIIFWGLSFIATKVALREVHPFTLLTLRFGMGGLLLLLFQLQKDRQFLRKFNSRGWLSIIFLALVGVSAHTLLQAYGLLYTTAIHTGWLIAIMPICIAIAARFYLGEPITLRKLGGILVGFTVVNSHGKVIGVVTDRDLCIALGTRNRLPGEITVGQVVSGEVFTCKPGDDIRDALNAIAQKKVRRLPVVNDAGQLEGILSMDDVVLHSEAGIAGKVPELSHDTVVNTFKHLYLPELPVVLRQKGVGA